MADNGHVSKAWTAIGEIHDPCSVSFGCPLSLVEMGLVKSIIGEGPNVRVELQLTEPTCMFTFRIVEEIESRLGAALGGDAAVDVRVLGPQDVSDIWDESRIAPVAMKRLRAWRQSRTEATRAAPIAVNQRSAQ